MTAAPPGAAPPAPAGPDLSSRRLLLRQGGLGGRGLFAPGAFGAGEVVFQDAGLLCIQDAASREAGPPTCQGCLRPLGGPAAQLRGLLEAAGAGAAALGPRKRKKARPGGVLSPDDRSVLEALDELRPPAALHRCPAGCDERFCADCAKTCAARHSLLCPAGDTGEHVDHALGAFCELAVEEGLPHYCLVASLYAQMAAAVFERGKEPGLKALEGAFAELELVPWSKCGDSEEAERRADVLQSALPLLSEVFVTPATVCKFPGGNTDALFSLELLDGLVGMLDHCVIDVDFDNPDDARLLALLPGAQCKDEPRPAKRRKGAELDHEVTTEAACPAVVGKKRSKSKKAVQPEVHSAQTPAAPEEEPERRKKKGKGRLAGKRARAAEAEEAETAGQAGGRAEERAAEPEPELDAELSPELVVSAMLASAKAEAAAQEAIEQSTPSGEAACQEAKPKRHMLPPVRGVALMRGVALSNHSCDPNAFTEWVGRAELRARASRPIAEGEEVLISYLGNNVAALDLPTRRARLQEGWGFCCQCARCRSEEAAAAA